MDPPNPSTSTLTSLRALLSAPAASTSSARTLPSPSPALSPPTSMPGHWSDTITSSFGSLAAVGRGRGKKGRRGVQGLWEEPLAEGGAGAKLGKERAWVEEEDRRRERERDEELGELAERILFQAGTDPYDPPGPLLVVAPVHIPSPTTHNHALLLDKLRLRLEAFSCSGGYSIVLLPSPTPNPPATALLASSYLALSRSARKNVRRVWLVGGGWWVRFVLTIFSTTLLSGKTAKRKKIVLCDTLSALAAELGTEGFSGIEFPAEVYAANSTTDRTIVLPTPPAIKMFEESLELLMGEDAQWGLPRVVKDCVAVIRRAAPTSVGLFRRSSSSATVRQVREAYDRGHPVSLAEYPDSPYLSSSLLKLFLRSLPTPIFPTSHFHLIRGCPVPVNSPILPSSPSATRPAVDYIRSHILPSLSRSTLLLLQPIVALLHEVSLHKEVNLMDSNNLVICLGPGFVGGLGIAKEKLEMCRVPGTIARSATEWRKETNTVGGVLKVMIDCYHEIFDEEDLRSFEPSSRAPLVAPDSLPSSFHSIPEEGIRRSPASPLAFYSAPSSPSSPRHSDPRQSSFPTSSTASTRSAFSQSSKTRRWNPGGLLASLPAEGRGWASGTQGRGSARSKASRGEVTLGGGVMGLFVMPEAGLKE